MTGTFKVIFYYNIVLAQQGSKVKIKEEDSKFKEVEAFMKQQPIFT